MIKQTSLDFLSNLKLNNSREWFEQNRDLYENYRSDILQLTENLLNELSKIDHAILQANLDSKKCLTRVNRDLRFSKDKTPYKNYVLVVFNKNYPEPNKAGYFIHIEPGNCSFGGGVWQTTPDYLKKIRQEIDYSFTSFNKTITTPEFQKTFPNGIQGVGKLKKMPDGYDETNPASELLKMKGFCTKEILNDSLLTSKECLEKVIGGFQTAKPLIDFLNKAIEYDG
ncbi:DUF2461 domain-containing protein [Algoriphagus algorifonticola]|uniref:DUF2461 domain-containing protein n=1 Tax=Algoriphagus algorifonticola TaxID=2593007 RepID=UPI0011A5430A|nr:DUF2461 domain-containing protein [Algoriphagus algorifonticola]